jgi:hypothetical protein
MLNKCSSKKYCFSPFQGFRNVPPSGIRLFLLERRMGTQEMHIKSCSKTPLYDTTWKRQPWMREFMLDILKQGFPTFFEWRHTWQSLRDSVTPHSRWDPPSSTRLEKKIHNYIIKTNKANLTARFSYLIMSKAEFRLMTSDFKISNIYILNIQYFNNKFIF